MDKTELDGAVNNELTHIPSGAKGSPQSRLRMAYNANRRADFGKDGKKQEPGVVLSETIAWLNKHYPDENYEFDETFFATITTVS